MSRPDPSEDVVRLLGDLGKTAVPLEDPQRALYRRERLIRLLGTKIEAQAQKQPAHGRKWLLLVAAAALAGLGVVGFAALRTRSVEAVTALAAVAGDTRSVQGEVAVRRGGSASSLRVGEVLVGGEVLSTGAHSGVEIGVASGRAALAASSELEIFSPTNGERRLRLGTGSVDVDLPHKLEAGKHLVIETPDVDVLVVGTSFTVDVGREGGGVATHVSVRRGTVWIMQNGKQRAVLRAGDDWRSPPNGEHAALVSPAPAPAVVPAVVPAARVGSGSRVSDAGTLAEENKLFQAALAARNAGDSAGAADAFASLLARYPRSVLREQALAGQFRALERAGRASAAAVSARRYLASYPTGFARADAERVTNGLLGER